MAQTDDFSLMKLKESNFVLLHLNIPSFNKHTDDLNNFFSLSKFDNIIMVLSKH